MGSDVEARWLVEQVAGRARPIGPVDEAARYRFDALLTRRAEGEPLQYVLGKWGFRTLDLMVDPRVLIPRPETEQVVEAALTDLDRIAAGAASGDRLIAVDLGTGSGAIALALAVERAGVEVWATDVSPSALAVAAANRLRVQSRAASRVHLVAGAWWAALPTSLRGRVDLVVSNPPYIASAEMSDLDQEVVGWEPRLALEAGPTGLEAVREIVGQAPAWLGAQGVVVIEIAPHQAAAATNLARSAGFGAVEVRPDLAGRDRILVARGAP